MLTLIIIIIIISIIIIIIIILISRLGSRCLSLSRTSHRRAGIKPTQTKPRSEFSKKSRVEIHFNQSRCETAGICALTGCGWFLETTSSPASFITLPSESSHQNIIVWSWQLWSCSMIKMSTFLWHHQREPSLQQTGTGWRDSLS